jgi:hypothetical protein
MIAMQETFAQLQHDPTKPQFTVSQWKIANILAIPKSAHLLLVIRQGVFIPKQIEGVEERICSSGQQIAELWLALRVKADNLAVENATATLEITA